MEIRVYRFAISVLLSIVAMGGANAQQCGSSITTCGCTIASAGVYTVDADLSAAQGLTSRGDCIDVAAKSVSLLIANHAIAGAGTGSGIHLLSSADHIIIEGYSGSTFGTLTGWENGLESEAGNVIADSMECHLNTTGILLQGAQNNTINRSNVFSNSVYGVWTKSASRNQISGIYAPGNGVAGIYVGCSGAGPLGQACKEDAGTSRGNSIYDGSFIGYQSYGIAVEAGSKQNTIITNPTQSDYVYDLFDGNPKCGGNTWRSNISLNQVATANQSCIQ